MRRFFIFLICTNILICLEFYSHQGICQDRPITEKGYYLSIRNYTPREYKARPQNWSIVQDPRGVLFFGNNDGVLEYDGIFWNTINIDDQVAFSLGLDSTGQVYVGGEGDFGRLMPDQTGRLIYQSLSNLLDSNDIDFGRVHTTLASTGGMYFQTETFLFRYDGDSIRNWPAETMFRSAFSVQGVLYLNELGRGLMMLESDSLKPVNDGDKFKEISIAGMIPYLDSNILVITENDGLYHMIRHSGETEVNTLRHFNEIDNFLFENNVTCAIRISEKEFAIGSENRGVIIYNQENDQFDFINYTSGLQDEVINDIHLGNRGNLWMALSNGISMSPAGSAVTKFDYTSGIKETIEAIERYEGKLFVAAYSGLHYLDIYQTSGDIPDIIYNRLYSRPGFRQIEDLVEPAWGLNTFKLKDDVFLIVGDEWGVHQIDGNRRVSPVLESYPWSMIQSTIYPERLIIANSYGIESVYKSGEKWIKEGLLDDYPFDCHNLVEDPQGKIWVGIGESGTVLNIAYGPPGGSIKPKVAVYDTSDGLPRGDVYVEVYNGNLILGTVKGLYKFDKNTEQFIEYKLFGGNFWGPERSIHRISVDHDNNLWLVTYLNQEEEYETGFLKPQPNGGYQWVKEPFLSFSKSVIHAVYHDPDGVSWLGGPDGLFRYDSKLKLDYTKDYHALLRKITIKGDSTIFAGTFTNEGGIPSVNQQEKDIPVINYMHNSFTFEFAAPNNEDGTPVLFSHYLEGFEDEWNEWSPEYRQQYTNLREKKYTFHLKAKNLYDHESAITSYTFVITPPWYRTIPAYLIFLSLAVGLVWLIITLYTKGLRNIIRERTAEIRQQKDIIEEKNKDIMSSIQYAERIQAALLPPGDYIEELFPERFIFYLPRDIVSGDYYWMTRKNGRIICATADCTGHGVPGAMMSMMGMSYLNEISSTDSHIHSNEIMDQLRNRIVRSLRQRGVRGESQDGMDMALYILDTEKMELEFSGAYLPLYLFRNGELEIIPADKMPIGISSRLKIPFTRHDVKLQKGDVLYTFSDGFQDQFGGPRDKKFKIKNFRDLLCKIHSEPIDHQEKLLREAFQNWKGSARQVDDITIIGVKV